MALQHKWMIATSITLAIALAGCGGTGGSGGGLVTTPPPAPPSAPPPSQPQAVAIFEAPATQEFAAFSVGDALRIRYDAASGQYEVMAPGQGWDRLIDEPESSTPNNMLFASAPNYSLSDFHTRVGSYNDPNPVLRYRYSSFASWRLTVAGQAQPLAGSTVFGMATPAGGVPVAGTATYQGLIDGESTVLASWGGGKFNAPVGGSVMLDFDFGRGSLAGQIRPVFTCDCDYPIAYPTLNFADTVFGVGSQTYSGKFDTSVSGGNSFSGLFTGPNAQELIGEWTFPFTWDGSPHSASGVWIAKRDN